MSLAACDNPTAPSDHLVGAWEFSFSAFDQQSCAVPAGLTPGCAGSGELEFLATDPVDVTHSFRGSCQSCGRAAEYGVVDQPLRTVRLGDHTVDFTLAACRFTATVPDAPAQTIDGTVVCRPDPAGSEVSGSWTMSRR
jgi:hypothetical protein